MEWISVETALPEEGKRVLVYCKPIGITASYYWGKNGKEVETKCNGWSIMDVTHWMPLPVKPNDSYIVDAGDNGIRVIK